MRRLLFLILAVNVVDSPAAFAAVSNDDIEQLREQLAAVSLRLEELAAENAALRQAQDKTATAVADVQTRVAAVQKAEIPTAGETWSDRIRLDGDFRYRIENIDAEGSSTRRRNRIRARVNIRADLADDIEVGFGLATGGEDPVSTKQTLGGGGSSKGVVLNMAYVDWQAADGLHLMGGKFKSPLYRPGKQSLMFDGDWMPEGLALGYKRDRFFINALGSYLESDSRKSNDTFSWGAQFGATADFGATRLTGGVGYFSLRTKGKSTTFGDPGDPGDYFGNSAVEASGLPCGSTADTDCIYLYDYLLTEVFAEAAFDLGNWPAVVFLDYVKNSDPSDNDTGWLFGARVGQARDRGQMEFSYLYADKDADATIGLLTDSDFSGGGTGLSGHHLKVNYGINRNWSISAQYFINEIDISPGGKSDYNRLMLDTQWKWK